MVALIQGSSINLIKVGSGKFDGFCKSKTSPLFTLKLMSLFAAKSPKDLETDLTSNINEQIAPTKMKGTPW